MTDEAAPNSTESTEENSLPLFAEWTDVARGIDQLQQKAPDKADELAVISLIAKAHASTIFRGSNQVAQALVLLSNQLANHTAMQQAAEFAKANQQPGGGFAPGGITLPGQG